MLIIPAVDLRAGRCVRLVHGNPDLETVYYDDPVQAAQRWQNEGAERLHLVDLDGAFDGTLRNAGIIEKIVRALHIPVQVGGGIRYAATASDLLARGVERVILGTVAVTAPQVVDELCARYPGRIMAGIDARNGKVAVRGWVEEAAIEDVALARRMTEAGVRELIYTDIGRDGTLTGPNLEAVRRLATAVPADIIASGGVSRLEDIKELLKLVPLGVTGIITGQAIYTGHLDLGEAIALAKGGMQRNAG
jgi:phosphoribosylformimino-5-aminoimidazole carboxamide ribotide isomerase